MTAYPAWTPASRPGIIPLHPLTFGTILGRSFTALRQNPRVLLGFALVVQAVAYVVVLVAVGAVAWASFSRLDTLQPGTEDFEAVLAGSIAITSVVGIVLGLAAGALGIIVQAVVVSEVAHAVLAEKLTLGALWRKVKPVIWRLIGYSLLLLVAVVAVVAAAGFGLFGIAAVAAPAAAAMAVLLVFAAIPLVWWLMVKLLLAPSAIIIERATIGTAIVRSWRLTRRRFWPILGILVLISLIFGGIAQVVSIPFSFLSTGLTTVIAPTGDADAGAVIALVVSLVLTQAVVLLIQAVAVVVQSTATALIYIDCRMRHEGLDLDLLAYVERRDAAPGATLPDPYLEHIGREVAPRLPAPGYAYPGAAYPVAYPSQPGYPAQPGGYYAPQPGYSPPPGGYAPPPGYPAQPGGYAPQPGYSPPPGGFAAPPAYPPQHASPAQPMTYPPQPEAPRPAAPQAPDATASAEGTRPPTSWTAPGERTDGTDRESPWS